MNAKDWLKKTYPETMNTEPTGLVIGKAYLAELLEEYAYFKIKNGEIRERELIDFATEMQKIGFNEMDSVEQTVSIYLKSIKERT